MADELGCNKIALGHHRDDMLETLLLNLFFGGKLAAMPPKLISDDGRTWSSGRWPTSRRRPGAFAAEHGFPIIPCNLCGSQENPAQADEGHAARWEKKHPTLRQSMLAALGNVNLSHLYDRSAPVADEASESIVPVRLVR